MSSLSHQKLCNFSQQQLCSHVNLTLFEIGQGVLLKIPFQCVLPNVIVRQQQQNSSPQKQSLRLILSLNQNVHDGTNSTLMAVGCCLPIRIWRNLRAAEIFASFSELAMMVLHSASSFSKEAIFAACFFLVNSPVSLEQILFSLSLKNLAFPTLMASFLSFDSCHSLSSSFCSFARD